MGEIVLQPEVNEDVLSSSDFFVTSRLGYKVELFSSSGEFLPVVLLPDDTTQTTYLYLGELNSLDGPLAALIRKFVKFIIERYYGGTVIGRVSFLRRLSETLQGAVSFFNAIDKVICDAQQQAKGLMVTHAKALIRFLIVHEYELDCQLTEIFLGMQGYSDSQNDYNALFMMDEEYGPFSREEVSVLLREVDNINNSYELRVILDLCLSFGLRPIQISLLKRKDLIFDKVSNSHYLRVPRVKGVAQYRRTNFTTRLLRESTVILLEGLFRTQENLPIHIDERELPILLRSEVFKFRFCQVYKFSLASLNYSALATLYQSEKKKSYGFHNAPKYVWRMLNAAEQSFPLSPRTGRRFHLNPYRFRYTIGTMAVVSGCTPEEVAELLDHQNVLSVKHYFRFSLEMWELLESATLNRIEQQMFTAAWMREEEVPNNIYSRAVHEVRGFSAIGRCSTQVACFEEPAVACYTCQRFCPNKSGAAHESVLQGLEARKSRLLELGESHLISTIDESIAGCKAAIAYSNGKPVVSIHSVR